MSVPPNSLGDAFAPVKLWIRLIVMHFRWLWGTNRGSVSRRLPRFNAGENYCQAQRILLPYKSKLASILLHSFMITALPVADYPQVFLLAGLRPFCLQELHIRIQQSALSLAFICVDLSALMGYFSCSTAVAVCQGWRKLLGTESKMQRLWPARLPCVTLYSPLLLYQSRLRMADPLMG